MMATIAPVSPQRHLSRISFGDLLYTTLAITGWLATTLLATAGCFVVLFLMAGNGSLAGFFEQVNLLAGHYLSADAARRESFDGQALVLLVIVAVGTGFFRRAALISIITRGGVDGPRHESRG